MKIKNLLILGLVLLGFTYCSSDDALPGATDNENATGVKMQLVVNMPTGVSTRSTTGTEDVTEVVGLPVENKASQVTVAIFNADGTPNSQYTRTLTASSSTSYKTDAFDANTLEIGKSYKVYLFVNPYSSLVSNTLDAAFSKTNATNFAEAISAIATDNKFFMSTANIVEAGIVLGTAKNETTPYLVTANVERAAARFDYKAAKTDNKYTIDVANNVGVNLVSYKLLNTSRTFYNLKRVNALGDATTGIIGGGEVVNNYVVDADWVSFKIPGDPTIPAWGDYLFSRIAGSATPGAFKSLTTDATYEKLDYVTENTLPTGSAKKGFATAVVFKGVLANNGTPLAVGDFGITATTDPVYVYNNIFYGVKTNLPSSLSSLDDADLAGAGVTGYVYDPNAGGVGVGGYPVYYTYYNRHNNNGNHILTGPMEFGVVRNNVYQLSITKINLFGNSNDPEITTPTNPDPNPENPGDPIESDKIYMSVEATVLPWTVRTNEIEF